MTLTKKTSVLALPLLLLGCGGGESGGGSSPQPVAKYTLNFYALENVAQSAVSNCAIYGQDDADNPTEYTVARKATGQNLNVYVHNEDGSLKQSYNSTNWSNGSFTFNQSVVPSDGYLSIVATNTAAGFTGYDILTIEKSLIPSSFNLNAKGQTSTSACITSTSQSSPQDFTGHISNDGDSQDGWFAFHSAQEEVSGAQNSPIEFSSISKKDVLAARYCRETPTPTTCSAGELLKFKFVTTANLGTAANPIELIDVDDSSLVWTPDTSAETTIDQANLNVYRSGTGAILWQALNTASASSYSYANSLDALYYLNVSGNHTSWDFEYTKQPQNVSVEIDESSTLADSNIPAVITASPPTLVGCAGYTMDCVEGYDATPPASLDLQRTLVQSTLGNISIRQSIYATAKQYQPLMSFDNGIDTNWNSSLDKVEVSLVESATNSDVENALLTSNFDAYAIANNTYLSKNYADSIGVLENSANIETALNKLLFTEYKIFRYSHQ